MKSHGLVSSLLFAMVVCAAACAKRQDPSWASPATNAVAGDATVSGAPAKISHFDSAPVIDGKLDDAAWATAAVLGPFVDAGEGAPDTSALAGSFARVGWDARALYFGFIVRDASPVAPFEPAAIDPHCWEKSSAVEIMLKPGDLPDNRDYYELQFDTRGATFDTHWDDYNTPITDGEGGKVFGHQTWSSKAQVASVVVADRFYSVEIAVPWSALGGARVAVPPAPGDVWRLNLYAFRDGQSIANAWSPLKRQGNFHKSSRFGKITFG